MELTYKHENVKRLTSFANINAILKSCAYRQSTLMLEQKSEPLAKFIKAIGISWRKSQK